MKIPRRGPPNRAVNGATAERGSGVAAGAVLNAPFTVRGFLKLALATAVAGAAQLAGGPREARATYTPGTPADTVDTNLTVQGNLVVDLNTGIGASTPQPRLDIAGEIRGNGVIVFGSDGKGKQCYLAGGTASRHWIRSATAPGQGPGRAPGGS